MIRCRTLLFFVLLWLFAPVDAHADNDNTKFVMLGYSGLDNEEARNTFLKHLGFFKNESDDALKVYSLEKALTSVMDAQRPMISTSVVLTIEDTSLDFLQNTLPDIRKNKMPVTLSITPSRIDRLPEDERTRTWQMLRNLGDDPTINFAVTSYDYVNLPALPYNEIKRQIISAKTRFQEMLGFNAVYFLYPYGAYSQEISMFLKEQKFLAAISSQSGVVSYATNKYALPRFTVTERYDDISHLQNIIEALPFPAVDIQPASSFLNDNPPVIGFSVPEAWMKRLSNLKCYGQDMGELTMTPLGTDRVELRFTEPFDQSRTRINCTWPVVDDEKKTRWRWLGFLFVKDIPQEPTAQQTTEQPALLP